MKEKHKAVWTAVLLTAAGLALVQARVSTNGRAGLPRGQSLWRLTYDIRLTDPHAGDRLRIALPSDGYRRRVLRQAFTHPSMAMDLVTTGPERTQEAVAVVTAGATETRWAADFDILIGAAPAGSGADEAALSADQRSRWLRSESRIQVHDPAVKDALDRIVRDASTPRKTVERIVEFCFEQIVEDPDVASDAATALVTRRGAAAGRARAMVALCRARRIPARLVSGFTLDREGALRPHVWVEAYLGKRWAPSDPENNYANSLPDFYVGVRVGGARVISSSGKTEPEKAFAAFRIDPGEEPGAVGASRKPADIVNLLRLPAGMQGTLAALLILPVGALITAVFRNLIGVHTFGTFSPCLLALSFVNSDWRAGLVIFVVIMGAGLAGRYVVSRLQLLMVSRLSVVLTLVVLCMTLAVSALDYWGLTPSARAALLPMVILTMMVERFHIATEEDGLREAFHTLAGTMLVAGCCLAAMASESLGRLILRHPEMLLIVAAALIMTGRYTGYRLSELWRFRRFADGEGGKP